LELLDKISGLMHENMVQDGITCFYAQTESRHFKIEVAISTYFIQTILILKDGFDSVKACYCQCKTGARTVGCCTYIASVLWYLEYYRYMENTS